MCLLRLEKRVDTPMVSNTDKEPTEMSEYLTRILKSEIIEKIFQHTIINTLVTNEKNINSQQLLIK